MVYTKELGIHKNNGVHLKLCMPKIMVYTRNDGVHLILCIPKIMVYTRNDGVHLILCTPKKMACALVVIEK